MFTCIVCRFEHRLDDVAVPLAQPDRCICIGCFARAAGDSKVMPKALRQHLLTVMAEVGVAA